MQKENPPKGGSLFWINKVLFVGTGVLDRPSKIKIYVHITLSDAIDAYKII
jgi:hypothetical protein